MKGLRMRNCKKTWLSIASLAVALTCAAEDSVATVRVGDNAVGPVNRRILGNNVLAYQRNKPYSMKGAGIWDPEKAAPVPEMIALLKDTGAKTLRWPGGCEAHEYNWKLTVGPLPERPEQAFGLSEFLKCCEAAGAEPVITLADYWGAPEDFADIVEYLNSPVGKNPNGGKDWAAVRASEGHPEPYNVVWFEYGNETYHGPHNKVGDRPAWEPYPPAEYAGRFKKVRSAMKAVDPEIKLGAVIDNENHPSSWKPWTYEIIKLTGAEADFFITHPYLPTYGNNDGNPSADKLFQSAFGSYRQFETLLKNLQEHILKTTGRRIPITATEYNGHFVQDKPAPYRLCLGTAVEVADTALTMMSPELNIDNAQYWQFSNEYWGMVAKFNAPYLKRPACLAFSLCNKYLGETLLKTEVECESYPTSGGYGILPATGATPPPLESLDTSERKLTPEWKIFPDAGHETKQESDGSLSIKIGDKPFDYWHAQFTVPAKPLTVYLVSAEIKTGGIPKDFKGVGIQVGDGRGWGKTQSAIGSETTRSTEWTKISCAYHSLGDTKSLVIMARRLGHGAKAAQPCSFQVRNFTIKECGVEKDLGPIPYVAAYASKDGSGSSFLLLTNHSISSPMKVRIGGMKGSQMTAETLSGPSVDATNEKGETCSISPLSLTRLNDGSLEAILPPHSLTGVKTW